MLGQMRYISVEGPIGVGKSTLAELLAAKMGAKLIQEKADENPFLKAFYSNMEQNAFQTQVYFLLSRWQQQQELFQPDLFSPKIVSDYLFQKDRLFAELALSPQEMELYEQIYETIVVQEPVKPDLVVYLYASLDRLIARVNKRAKSYENNMHPEYLESVVKVYNEYFFSYDESALLMVNTDSIDFVQNQEDFLDLYRKIEQTKSGTHHFNPAGNLPLK